jgi:hypothetical protein
MKFLNSNYGKENITCIQKKMTDYLRWEKKNRLADTLSAILEVRLEKCVKMIE